MVLPAESPALEDVATAWVDRVCAGRDLAETAAAWLIEQLPEDRLPSVASLRPHPGLELALFLEGTLPGSPSSGVEAVCKRLLIEAAEGSTKALNRVGLTARIDATLDGAFLIPRAHPEGPGGAGSRLPSAGARVHRPGEGAPAGSRSSPWRDRQARDRAGDRANPGFRSSWPSGRSCSAYQEEAPESASPGPAARVGHPPASNGRGWVPPGGSARPGRAVAGAGSILPRCNPRDPGGGGVHRVGTDRPRPQRGGAAPLRAARGDAGDRGAVPAQRDDRPRVRSQPRDGDRPHRPRLALAVEIDGYYHFQDPEAYRRDRRKDWSFRSTGTWSSACWPGTCSRARPGLETILGAIAFRRAGPGAPKRDDA